jgi:hypothetical protein
VGRRDKLEGAWCAVRGGIEKKGASDCLCCSFENQKSVTLEMIRMDRDGWMVQLLHSDLCCETLSVRRGCLRA